MHPVVTADPTDRRRKDTVYFTRTSNYDEKGLCRFSMEWWSEGFHMGPSWRGQMFSGNLQEYVNTSKAAGNKVKITVKL